MIVVTAPTSQIGRQLLGHLVDGDEPVRVVVRDPDRLPDDTRDRVDVVEGSHAEPDVVAEAFAGAGAVFWLVPPDPQADSAESLYVGFSRPALEALTEAEVRHVVGVSALGRGTPRADRAGLVTATLALDDLIAGTGVAYRALTMPSFMDNLLRQRELIRDHGLFTSPISADLRLPTCATRDIAAVAAGLLIDRSWSGTGEVPVMGPEDLSFDDMARMMSEVLERPVRFQQVSAEDFTSRMTGMGMSDAMAQGQLEMLLAKDAGLDLGVERTPENATPTDFRAWCREVLAPAVTG